MQGPVVEIVLLVLIVLLFGIQQRSRPQVYYRLWFVGWILILLSYGMWELPVETAWFAGLQDALRFDLVLGGTLFFMLSFVAKRERFWSVVGRGMLVGVPVVAIFNVLQFRSLPRVLMIVAVLAWQGYGVAAAYWVLPRGRTKTRLAIYGICVGFAVAIVVYVDVTRGRSLMDWALAEVLLCTAVLYGGGLRKRTLAVYLGMVGFVTWAAFYLLGDWFEHGWPRALAGLFLFWSVPKYFVGLSMVLKTFEDATEENTRRAEEYRSLYDDFRMLYEEHPHPMWIFEPETGRILSTNLAAESAYGYSGQELLRMKVDELELAPDDETAMVDEMVGQPPGERRTRYRGKNGQTVWVNLMDRVTSFRGKDARLRIVRDVTDRLNIHRELAHRANHDVLTGLPNRTLLEERIEECMRRSARDGRKAALFTVDVDHFKRINDTYGHPVGDHCLRIVAARLASKVRQVDTIARVGGEEFAAMIGGMHTAADAEKIAASLLRVFAQPLRVGDLELAVTVSVGVAVYPDDGEAAAVLWEKSDAALYAAKRAGRNCAVYASAMKAVERAA